MKSDPKMTTRVLFVGQGIFSDGLTRLLLDFPSVEIIGAVGNCADARDVVLREMPDVLIVDHAQSSRFPSELNDLMESVDSLKVISLTLTENRMVIHNRQQMANVTLPILMKALQLPNSSTRSGLGR